MPKLKGRYQDLGLNTATFMSLTIPNSTITVSMID